MCVLDSQYVYVGQSACVLDSQHVCWTVSMCVLEVSMCVLDSQRVCVGQSACAYWTVSHMNNVKRSVYNAACTVRLVHYC